MKIAIKGHESRGKEVIQIFKDLGTEGLADHTGSNENWVYLRDDFLHPNQLIVSTNITFLKEHGYKVYTLEEFEKEFLFKIGDKVRDCSDDEIGIILDFIDIDDELMYLVNFEKSGHANMPAEELKPYKEMKKERNITLTLDKAKEWYKKGGELKEIALQAFTEKELNPLPRTWAEFSYKYKICSTRYAMPSKYAALYQLEQLRDCWRQGNIPQELKYKIRKIRNIYTVVYGAENAFLSFCDKQTAEEFLECFEDLIEKAGDLI